VNGRARLTPIGAVLLTVLVAALVALFVGSRTVQGVGFVVALIVILILLADHLPRMRVLGGNPMGVAPPRRRRGGGGSGPEPRPRPGEPPEGGSAL
jgi:hypothetical protein